MKGVDTIARVRRDHLVRGRSIKEIARELHISRNTVRKILRSGDTEFVYERTVQPQPKPKLGLWRSELDRLLAVNAARSSRERLTLIRVFEELRGLGYGGGYDAVRRYAASWRREQSSAISTAFVPLSFAPGEACQFDWSHEIVLINGVTVTVKVAHALRNGAPFKDWVLPAALERVRRKLRAARDGDRQMVEILGAVLTDGFPAVEAAGAEALKEGVHSADVILNILARRRDPEPPVTIMTPEALRLRREPTADCARYDSLRRAI